MCAAIRLASLERGGRRQLDVEGDERRPGGDQHRAGGGVQSGGPKSGCSSPASIRRWSADGPPRLSSRAGSSAGEDPVQEHGERELVAEQVGQHERLGAGGAAVLLGEVDDRRDVDGADARVHALMRVELDRTHRLLAPRATAWASSPGGPGQGIGAAVVVDVGVNVEQRVAEGLRDPRRWCSVSCPSETFGYASSVVKGAGS